MKCCLCENDSDDEGLTDYERDFIEYEGTCVDCMMVVEDTLAVEAVPEPMYS